MKENMWIRNPKIGNMIDIIDCVEIYPIDHNYNNVLTHHIKFCWIEYYNEWGFNTKEKRDNVLEQIKSLLKPQDIDPNQKPLKL